MAERLRYSFAGVTKSGTFALTIKNVAQTKTLSRVQVACPTTVNESTAGTCAATAVFSDNSTSTVTTSASWTESSPYATINNSGVLRADAVPADQPVTVTAGYTFSGVTKSGTFALTIKNVAQTKTLSRVQVACPTTVNESTTGTCAATAVFSDNSTSTVTTSASWTENSAYATINSSGVLSAAEVPSDQPVTVSANYTSAGVTKFGIATLTIKNKVAATNYLLSVSKSGTGAGGITGTSINCGSACSAQYASGTSVTLTATATSGSVFAGWSGACAGSGVCTVAMTQTRSVSANFSATSAYNGNWQVPYLRQTDYADIGNSACGPTSAAMLLQFFYPQSRVDMPEIYHSGTQNYSFTGAAKAYRNIDEWSFPKRPVADQDNYNGPVNAGMSQAMLSNYLGQIWGIATKPLDEDGVYQQIRNAPLLGHVFGHGNLAWGHFVVIRGIDDRGTPNDRTDDIVYINDPFDRAWGSWDTSGKNKAIPYAKFFRGGAGCGGLPKCNGAWFRDAMQLVLPQTVDQRQSVVVVDTGHNSIEGNPQIHRLDLDDASKWTVYVGNGGDWYYPNKGETGRSARWTPKLPLAGYYEVTVMYRADNANSTSVQYNVHSPSGSILATQAVNQYSGTPAWRAAIISPAVYMSAGSYVRVSGVAAGTNVDAIRLRLVPH